MGAHVHIEVRRWLQVLSFKGLPFLCLSLYIVGKYSWSQNFQGSTVSVSFTVAGIMSAGHLWWGLRWNSALYAFNASALLVKQSLQLSLQCFKTISVAVCSG